VKATPNPVQPGGQITYAFTATNQGETELSGVQLRNTVPGFVERFDDDATDFTCSGFDCEPGETMTWELGTLPAGQGRSGTFAALVESGDDAPPENTVITTSRTCHR